jgi:hypothetical protein
MDISLPDREIAFSPDVCYKSALMGSAALPNTLTRTPDALMPASSTFLSTILMFQVALAIAAQPVEFVRDVVPVLTKAGCNAGSCHGSFQGRGGFRLSLLGFDPQADHEAIVLQGRGRRVMPSAPENSLLLKKPTAAVGHGGGKRLDVDSKGYRILHQWLQEGMSSPDVNGARVAAVKVEPAEIVLKPGEQRQLRVEAHWSDGAVQVVTDGVLYESTQDTVAEVSGTGLITVHRSGGATITLRYLGQSAAVPVMAPYGESNAAASFRSNNFIDQAMSRQWRQLQLTPAPLADETEFMRRVYLDLIGTLPSPDDVRQYLASTADDKRARLIDELLQRGEYVDYWTLKWSDLLRAHRRSLGEKGLATFNAWLRQALRENRPIEMMVRQLLTAQGNLYQNGAAAFYYVDQTPEELAETTAQVLLGVRLQCAKCHHHPYEAWSQDDYYGLAAVFARVQRKDTMENGRYGGAQSVRLAAGGKVTNPATGSLATASILGHSLSSDPDPRRALADWLTQQENPYFARNVVNRYWGYLFGRGLVEPVDDLRSTNPASHPALLDNLARDFVEHGYDLKHLLRTLCNSSTYQLAAEFTPQRDTDGMFFTHRRPRRLPAEVLLDAINQAAGVEETFNAGGRGRFGNTMVPHGTRAIALPDPTVNSYFLDAFGRPNRTTSCECDRSNRSDLGQVLHLANGEQFHAKIVDAKGRIARRLAGGAADPELIDELYLATFCRWPNGPEREAVSSLIAAAPTRKEGFEDLLWALLNSTEFVFNH